VLLKRKKIDNSLYVTSMTQWQNASFQKLKFLNRTEFRLVTNRQFCRVEAHYFANQPTEIGKIFCGKKRALNIMHARQQWHRGGANKKFSNTQVGKNS